jgi:hypothetical protein
MWLWYQKTILKLTLEKQVWGSWTEFTLLNVGSYEHGNEPSNYFKGREFLDFLRNNKHSKERSALYIHPKAYRGDGRMPRSVNIVGMRSTLRERNTQRKCKWVSPRKCSVGVCVTEQSRRKDMSTHQNFFSHIWIKVYWYSHIIQIKEHNCDHLEYYKTIKELPALYEPLFFFSEKETFFPSVSEHWIELRGKKEYYENCYTEEAWEV